MSFFRNGKNWPLKPLKEIATLKRGYDLPVQDRTEGNIPIFAANGENGSHNKAKVKGPGVITGRSEISARFTMLKVTFGLSTPRFMCRTFMEMIIVGLCICFSFLNSSVLFEVLGFQL